MNIGGSSQNHKQARKGSRRTWSKEEEEALLNVLDDVVAHGQRCDSGQFKSGTLRSIERKLAKICPVSGLKAHPHIESKLKKWKKQYVMICDMLNKSGFEWNDVNKCVKVDSDEVWLSYAQNNRDARGWRGRYFPLYERLANIFGNNRAARKEAQTPIDVVEENDLEEMNTNDNGMDAAPSPVSVTRTVKTQPTNQSQSSRPCDNFIAGMSDVAGAFIKMLEKFDGRMLVLAESLKPKDENYPKFIAEELKRLDVPIGDRIKASKALKNDPTNVEILKSLDSIAQKMEFITALLNDG